MRKKRRKARVRQVDLGLPPSVPAAFHGPLGELVKVLEPYNEADPVALLINAIVGFGSLLGADAHVWSAVIVIRPASLPCSWAIVAKARKGMSWNPIYDVLTQIDRNLAANGSWTALPPAKA